MYILMLVLIVTSILTTKSVQFDTWKNRWHVKNSVTRVIFWHDEYLQVIFRYTPEMITFMPVSGWTGENVTKKSDKLSWYNGPTLLEALDTLEKINLKDLPLRVSVQDVYRIGGIGTVVVGRVETGVLTVKDKITVAPGNLNSYVKSIEQCYETVDEAIPGDVICFSIRGLSRKDVRRGSVIGHTYDEPPFEAIDFVAQIRKSY